MKTLLATATAACLLLVGCSSAATPAAGPATSPAGSTATPIAPEKAKSVFAVTIGDSHVTKDYQGKQALVVDFSFQNNSDKATSFIVAVSAKAFQNGVQLETGIVTGDKKFDAANSMKEIKPGASIQAQYAYVLADTSDVTVEVTELISLNTTPIATKTISVK